MLYLCLFDIFYLFDSFLNRHTQVIKIDGFCGKVKGTVIHSRTDITHVAISRHHDALHCGIVHLVNLGEQCQTVHLRHVDVREDNINVFLSQQHRQGFQTIMGEKELVFAFANLSSEVLR